MKKNIHSILLLLLLASCSSYHRNENLTVLKRELISAQKELSQVQIKVSELEESVARSEIEKIRDQFFIASKRKLPEDFASERKTLAEIIRKHSACATDAQTVLDQILAFITDAGDELAMHQNAER